MSVNISRNNGRAHDYVILEGRGRTGDWYILRNCWDYERGVNFLRNVLGARRKKVRPVCSTISESFEQQCPRVMFRGTRKEAYPEDAYPEMQHVPDT